MYRTHCNFARAFHSCVGRGCKYEVTILGILSGLQSRLWRQIANHLTGSSSKRDFSPINRRGSQPISNGVSKTLGGGAIHLAKLVPGQFSQEEKKKKVLSYAGGGIYAKKLFFQKGCAFFGGRIWIYLRAKNGRNKEVCDYVCAATVRQRWRSFVQNMYGPRFVGETTAMVRVAQAVRIYFCYYFEIGRSGDRYCWNITHQSKKILYSYERSREAEQEDSGGGGSNEIPRV